MDYRYLMDISRSKILNFQNPHAKSWSSYDGLGRPQQVRLAKDYSICSVLVLYILKKELSWLDFEKQNLAAAPQRCVHHCNALVNDDICEDRTKHTLYPKYGTNYSTHLPKLANMLGTLLKKTLIGYPQSMHGTMF